MARPLAAILAWLFMGLALSNALLERYAEASYYAAAGAFFLVDYYGRKLTTDRTP